MQESNPNDLQHNHIHVLIDQEYPHLIKDQNTINMKTLHIETLKEVDDPGEKTGKSLTAKESDQSELEIIESFSGSGGNCHNPINNPK